MCLFPPWGKCPTDKGGLHVAREQNQKSKITKKNELEFEIEDEIEFGHFI
jgi:uncharacterized protein YbaR (Trm112 family)